MLLTFIALRSLWRVWRKRRERHVARMSLRQLTEIDISEGEDDPELRVPFWRAVLARFRTEASQAERRRARSRKAMFRLSRISERKHARYSSSQMDMRSYAARQGEAGAG